MKTEKFYEELKGIIVDNRFDIIKYQKLLEKLEKAIREESCYKTSSKTRVNAIKRVASKDNCRPALKGFGIMDDFKVVTDSYHLIAIHQDEMPLPMVATSDELKAMGIDHKEYMEKYGRNSLINATYPNIKAIINYDTSNELPMIDLDDLESFCKLHKKDNELYKIGEQSFNPHYVKNVVDVLGKEFKIYYQGEYRPLFFVNDKEEIGLVLPVKKY